MKKYSNFFDMISLIIMKFGKKCGDVKLFLISLFTSLFILIISMRYINNSFSIFFLNILNYNILIIESLDILLIFQHFFIIF